MSYATLDTPATSADLDDFHGLEVSQYERNEATKRAKSSYDADDLSNDAYEHFEAINAALEDGDEMEAGRLLQAARQATIARQASRLAYGIDQPNVLTGAHCFSDSFQALEKLTIRVAA
jgi:hypothetical protein